MAAPKCPKCKRKGTYNAKYGQCSACGLGREPVTPAVTEKFIPEIEFNVAAIVPADALKEAPCRVCGCPGHNKPMTGAERQKAWRARQRSNGSSS